MISLPSELPRRVHGKVREHCITTLAPPKTPLTSHELESLKNSQHSNRTLHSLPGKQELKGKGRTRAAIQQSPESCLSPGALLEQG